MSLGLYDDAIVNKLKQWTQKTDVRIYGPQNVPSVFELQADDNNDNPLKLPIIAVRRNGGYRITNPNKQPLSYDGLTYEAVAKEDSNKSVQINAIPISIDYQIDVYTRYFNEADELIRNFVFNLVNYPKIVIYIPYNNIQIEHDSALLLSQDVMDNSDVPERLIRGQFTRLSLNVTITDAYLWDIRVRDNYTIDTNLKVEN